MKMLNKKEILLSQEEDNSEHLGKIKQVNKILHVIYIFNLLPIWGWFEYRVVYF